MRRLKSSAKRAAASSHGQASSGSTLKFSASKIIPSWNCIARENSKGSLEEDFLADVASTFHQGVAVARGTSTGRNLRTQRNLHHDGSDSESENVDLNSRTRSGRPLMRTTSANKFIEFVHSLDVDSELRKDVEYDQRDFSNRISTGGSSITVTEGDFLQSERIHNGLVLNIVKKEDLAHPNKIHDLENYNSEVPECVQLDCPEKDMDASSESDYAADDDDNSPAIDSMHKTASTPGQTDDSVVHDIQDKHVVDG
ncbi:hypothetical protein SADUNF_Sadunf15G0107600 [Salix dunnii]|uniref:Uncharacterized protein n=1 Tax=Salix dunnii TaxID=1413687 RepID=A0A835JF17_9ROSI|nr:hypothetical protein SADUNF_Sadunf15G0107600 [Salix dunnii]